MKNLTYTAKADTLWPMVRCIIAVGGKIIDIQQEFGDCYRLEWTR